MIHLGEEPLYYVRDFTEGITYGLGEAAGGSRNPALMTAGTAIPGFADQGDSLPSAMATPPGD